MAGAFLISGRETKMNEPRSLLSKTHGPLGERDKVVDSCRVIDSVVQVQGALSA